MQHRMNGWPAAIGAGVLAWGFLIAGASCAFGHGYDYSDEENAWFNRQVAIDGTKCCDRHDAHVGENVDWRMVGGHFEVHVMGRWHRVPPERIMRSVPEDPSPFGSAALLFWSPAPWSESGFSLWCFRPGIML
jgi:hypothetical protein